MTSKAKADKGQYKAIKNVRSLEIVYTSKAQQELQSWKKAGNRLIQKKISDLLSDIVLHPETGLGKPEPLKHNLSGFWSRRINQEHRLVYADYYYLEALKRYKIGIYKNTGAYIKSTKHRSAQIKH